MAGFGVADRVAGFEVVAEEAVFVLVLAGVATVLTVVTFTQALAFSSVTIPSVCAKAVALRKEINMIKNSFSIIKDLHVTLQSCCCHPKT